MLTEKTFQAGSMTINYAEGPASGPPLVLLHDNSRRWQSMMSILPNLVLRWHLYVPDLRGHGNSGRAPGHYCLEDYASDIVSFVDRELAEPAVIFGHAMGAWVAIMTAARLPEKMRAVILGAPALNTERWVKLESTEGRIGLYAAMRRLAASGLPVSEIVPALANLPIAMSETSEPIRYGDMPGVDGARLRHRAKTMSQLDPDVLRDLAEGRAAEFLQGNDLNAEMAKIACPLLLLQADPDLNGALTDSDVNRAMALVADGRFVKFTGIGPDLGLESWHVTPLLRSMSYFLESL